ncbi:MAG: transposase, partial [Candidatus Heimdallarchaeota archaeon]|nr:transposase [Candidatus Heimdallarchaeota archaeon]
MLQLSKLDPDRLRIHLVFLKDFLRPRFPEPKRSKNPQGAKRKWSRWLVVALALIGAEQDYTWQQFTDLLSDVEEVLIEFGAKGAPKKTSLYNAWKSIPANQIKSLTTQTARFMVDQGEDSAIDSTGFLLKTGDIWRFVKYQGTELKRSSKKFFKFHIMVSTSTKTIMGVEWSKSPEHDYQIGLKLIPKIGKRLFSRIIRNYGDKAYTGDKMAQKLLEMGVRHIVEPKSNAIYHGTDTARDRSIRLYQRSSGLWKYSNKHGQKSAVEQVFGEIKIKKNGINSRNKKLFKKQVLLQFFMFNLAKLMEPENFGRWEFL